MPTHRLDVAALYSALDTARRRQRLSWRDIARQAGIPSSTFARLGLDGRRPSADALVSLLTWLAAANGTPAPPYTTPATPERTPDVRFEVISEADIGTDPPPPLQIPAVLAAAHANAVGEWAAASARPTCPEAKRHHLDGVVAGLEHAARLLTAAGLGDSASEHLRGPWVAVLEDGRGETHERIEDVDPELYWTITVLRGEPGGPADVLYSWRDSEIPDWERAAYWERAQLVAEVLNAVTAAPDGAVPAAPRLLRTRLAVAYRGDPGDPDDHGYVDEPQAATQELADAIARETVARKRYARLVCIAETVHEIPERRPAAGA